MYHAAGTGKKDRYRVEIFRDTRQEIRLRNTGSRRQGHNLLLGNREIAVDSELDVYSEASPLGAAILGLEEGEKTTYTAPNGREIAVEVVKVETYSGQ